MKAEVQYNDFNGTVAADISDHHNLSDYLDTKGVDTDKYEPIGTKFYPHYKGGLAVSVICVDKEKSTKEDPYIIEIELEGPIEYEEYFNLFKRFVAIVIGDYYQKFDIKNQFRVDELGEEDEQE